MTKADLTGNIRKNLEKYSSMLINNQRKDKYVNDLVEGITNDLNDYPEEDM